MSSKYPSMSTSGNQILVNDVLPPEFEKNQHLMLKCWNVDQHQHWNWMLKNVEILMWAKTENKSL